MRFDKKSPSWISMLSFRSDVLIGISLRNSMFLTQTFIGLLLEVCYIYQSAPCGDVLRLRFVNLYLVCKFVEKDL